MLPSIVASARPATLATAQAIAAWKHAYETNVVLARADPSLFAGLVLRDEKTGRRIHQAPVHEEWHELLSAHRRVVVWSAIEMGKSNQVSVARSLYELGRNPNLRIAVISARKEGARKIVRNIAQYIERSEDLRRIFPHLVPARAAALPWTTEAITVERSSLARDPSFQACGVHGNIIGSRIDGLILDDILSQENTSSAAHRGDTASWVYGTLFGRLSEDAFVWCVGNAWNPADLMHELAALPRYRSFRYPVLDEKGVLLWPERWSRQRIDDFKLDNVPLEYARQLLCMARDEGDSVCKAEWVATGKTAGEGYSPVESIEINDLPDGYAVVTGVDLASSKSESADLTALVTVLLHPDGTRQVLWVRSGRMSGPEIIAAIEDVYRRYGGIVIVENNAAQQYIVQFAQAQTCAAVIPFRTGKQKADPTFGVQGIFAELAGGKWLVPNKRGKCVSEVDALLVEMLHYTPAEHTGDRLMALWFAREWCRRFDLQRKGVAAGMGMRAIG